MLASVFHCTLPAIQKGYPLPPLFSVVVPIARTNLVTNPSVETATTNYTAVGGSIARSTTQQYHGAYSLAVTPTAGTTDGVKYGTISLTSGTLYAISCKFLGIAGVKYALSIATTGGVGLGSYRFRATGRWQWVWLYYLETASTTRDLYVQKDVQTSTGVFYVDGLQVEAINAGEYVSTYIDGDQQGLIANQSPPAYVWNGTPHASTSSRSGQTRAGGMVMRLDWYGFVLLTMIGLGLPTPTNISQQYVQLDGAAYERTQKPPRQFTLGGRFDAQTFPQLQRQISDLTSVLDRDYVATQQPLTLLYQGLDGCDAPTSDTGRIICSYQGGLEGVTDNLHAEQTSAVFRQWLPTILSNGEGGASLAVQSSISNANYILQRSTSGTWSAMGTGGTGGAIWAMARGLDGTIYAGGQFTGMSGVANTNQIAKWNGSAWTALGTGVTGGVTGVYALAIAPNGDLYAAGDFTSMGGVANTNQIAKWNGSAWSAVGTGVTTGSTSNALAIGPDGSVYLGGDFTNVSGTAANRIAKWNGSAWSALGTGLNGFCGAIAVDQRTGVLYAGGTFTTAGGNTATYVAKWNGSAWSGLGTGAGVGTRVGALALGTDGTLYIGGIFSSLSGVAVANVASWNGSAISPLGSGVDDQVYAIVVEPMTGIVHIGGHFTTAGGMTPPDRVVRWFGGAYLAEDIDLPGSADVGSILAPTDGTLYLGFTTNGTATAAGLTTATNAGTARAYPRLTIKGPSSGSSRIFQLINYSTRRAIYLNLTLNAGETATFIFDPAYLSFTTDFQGNILSKILPGSNEADFMLQPGANIMSFFAADNTVTATLVWCPAFNSIADLTP